MTLKLFWQIIENARNEADTCEDLYDALVEKLSELELTDILMWEQIFYEYQVLSYKSKLWAAAYIINDGCSDDGFDYFRPALMILGKSVFLEALKNPDSLASLDIETDELVEFEEMLSVGYEAFIKKQNIETSDSQDIYFKELDKYPISEEIEKEMISEIKYAEDIDIEWGEDTDLENILPALCEKFLYDSSDSSGSDNPLIEASKNGNLKEVKELIKNGDDVNAKDKDGDTALILASIYGHLEIIKLLVLNGADINATDIDTRTSLMLASVNARDLEIIKYLVENGSLVNSISYYGDTALMLASQYGHLEVVQYLVQNKADVHIKDNEEKTALMWATEQKHIEVAQYLESLK